MVSGSFGKEIEDTKKMLLRLINQVNKYWTDASRNAQCMDNKQEKILKKRDVLMGVAMPITSSIFNERMGDYIQQKKITIGGNWRGTDDKYRIFMPPLMQGEAIIPLINFHYDYSNGRYHKIRIGVEIEPEHKSSERMDWVEYRFETPHDGSLRIQHDFFHVQVSGGVEDAHWINKSTPCLPLPVDNHISLFYCMIASFYGKDKCKETFSGAGLDGRYVRFLEKGMGSIIEA